MPSAAAPHPIGSNLPLISSLPKVSFRRIPSPEAQTLATPAGVADQQNINFGFNDGSQFLQPDRYMRYVEPIEADLKKQVEYDMDEQDKEWLDALNADRKKDQLDLISYELFEIIIDRLEKEWFDLMRRVPSKPQPAAIGPDGEPVSNNEDTECAICDDGECENSNAIVFCDGCNLAVHQDCYGIPYIPEGQWLCRKCTVSPDRAVSCILCPNEGGAFKQTTHGKWAHLMCAMWIPETGVSNPVYMEPIDSIERIPKARWKLQCYLCRHRHGACIQCDNKNCFAAFHVTCARKSGLLIKTERQRAAHSHGSDDDDDQGGEPLQAMCHKHLPKHLRQQYGPFSGSIDPSPSMNGKASGFFDDDDSSTRASTPMFTPTTATKPVSRKFTIRRGPNGTVSAVPRPASTTKSARAYKKSYRVGPPLVPNYVTDKVFDYVNKVRLRRKPEVIAQIAKFWSLKREARRGAPLLKRLHLEPWTANAVSKEESEAERVKKLHFMMCIREELEKLRMLAELVRKREREKLRQMDLIRRVLVQQVLFPFHQLLREATDKIIGLDRMNLFLSPVSRAEVPDYYDVVKRPMQWATISARVDEQQYETVQDFVSDVHLVLDNATLYNKPETSFHRAALKIRKASEPILAGLSQLAEAHRVQAAHDADGTSPSNDEQSTSSSQQLSDSTRFELEPPAWVLQVLEEYDDEQRLRSMGEAGEDEVTDWENQAPKNLVEDLTWQWQHPAKPELPEEDAAGALDDVVTSHAEMDGGEVKETGEDNSSATAEAATEKQAEGDEDAAAKASTSSSSRKRRVSLGEDNQPTARSSKRQRAMTTGNADLIASSPAGQEHAADDSGPSSSTMKRSRSDSHTRHRGRSSTLGDSDAKDLEVKELDAWDTFKRFEEGWILPEGSRRARRMTQPLPSASASASSSKLAVPVNGSVSDSVVHKKNRASMSSVSFSDPEQHSAAHNGKRGARAAAVEEESELSDLSEHDDDDEDDDDGDGEDPDSTSTSILPKKKRKRARRSSGNDTGESLRGTSAATQKRGRHGQFVRKDQSVNQPRKSHGASDHKTGASANGTATEDEGSSDTKKGYSSTSSSSSSSRRRAAQYGKASRGALASSSTVADNGSEAEEGEADEDEDEDEATTGASSSTTTNGIDSAPAPAHKASDFPPGTLVWSKVYSFPYFPAEIMSESSPLVPKAVKASKEALPPKEPKGSAMHLVRFFDHARSFGWVATSHVKFLFEDQALDEKMKAAAKGKHAVGVRKALVKAQMAADGVLEED